jgi:hypothetical protein
MIGAAVPEQLPPRVSKKLGFLLERILALGFTAKLDVYFPESFDHFEVTFSRGDLRFKIQHDRSQLMVYGDEQQIQVNGLNRAFSGWRDLETPLMNWLGSVA